MLCARALETWFGDLSATTRRLALGREVRARLPPPGRTRPFPARSVESSSPPCPHATQPVRLLPYWDVSAIFVLPSPSDACAPLPAGEDRHRAPTRFVREARGATRVARSSAEPACWPSPGPPPGPRGRRFGPPGSKRACGSDTAKRCFRADPASSRLSVQKYLFTRRRFASSASAPRSPERAEARGAVDLFKPHSQTSAARQSQYMEPDGAKRSITRTARGTSVRPRPRRSDTRGETRAAAAAWHEGTVKGVARACP